MSEARPKFRVLDSWRGLAALAVAVNHLHGTAFFLSGTLHRNLSLAVDFFFVLSGFVIAASYGRRLSEGFGLWRFMGLRLGRVWPLHATLVLAYLALETAFWLKTGGGSGENLGVLSGRVPFTGPRELATLPVSLFLLQAWLYPWRDLWNAQSWSISVEVGLYLGIALLWKALGPRAYAVAITAAFIALGLLLAGSDAISDQILRGVGGFGLGLGCWLLHDRCAPAVGNLPAPLVALLELAALPVLLAAAAANWSYFAMDLLFGMTLLLFAGERGPVSRLLLTAPLVWLGTLSYGLYMVHGLVFGRVLDVVGIVQTRLGATWVSAHLGGEDLILLPPLPTLALCIGMIGTALLAAWIGWRLVEDPARRWSRRMLLAPVPAPRAT